MKFLPEKDKQIIWPAYLDSNLSRGMGRKVNKNKAVIKPSVEEMIEALKSLGLNPKVEDKKYPKLWYEQNKAVIIDKKYNKTKLLAMISNEINKMRAKKSK